MILERLAKVLHPARWDGKPEPTNAHGRLVSVYAAGAEAWFRIDPKRAYDELAPLLAPKRVADPAGERRADAVLMAAPRETDEDPSTGYAELDPRWAKAVAPYVAHKELWYTAGAMIRALPPEPRALAPLLAKWKNPAKLGYVSDDEVELLLHVADASAVRWLVGMLDAADEPAPVLRKLRELAEPSAAPMLQAWIDAHADDGDASLIKLARKVVTELAKRGPVPSRSTPPKSRAKAKRSATTAAPARSTLVFAKGPKPRKRHEPGPLDQQWQEVEALFAKANLPVEKARAVASEGVWLWTTRKPESALPVGSTKIGGHPDLPASTPWPIRRGKYFAFVAQLDLEAIAEALAPGPLPARGLLTFFVADDPSGETGYLDDCAVLYTRPSAKLVRRDVPDDYTGPIYQACAVELRPVVKLPGRESERASKVLRAGAKTYAAEVFDYAVPENQVLGARDHATDNSTRANERLLLQLVSDPQAAMTWGDADLIGFLITEAALAKRDFSKVHVVTSE